MSRIPRALCAALWLTTVTAPVLPAQELSFLSGVFSNISDVDASFVFGSTIGTGGVVADSGQYGLRGLSFEVTLGLGNLISWGDPCPESGPTVKEIQRHLTGANGKDSVVIIQPKAPKACERDGLVGELGFGYTQLGRFRGNRVALNGAIEELPFVTLYGSVGTDLPVTPYVGIRGGLVRLKDFRATVAGGGIKGTGSTFEYGGVAGLGVSVGSKAVLFAEFALTYRTFDGVAWAPATTAVPAELLGPIRMDTRSLAVGAQLQFKGGN